MGSFIELEIKLNNGDGMKFSQPASQPDDSVKMLQLQHSLKKIQEECNKALTEVINSSKKTINSTANSKSDSNHGELGDDEDDDGDEDDEENAKEPTEKRIKR